MISYGYVDNDFAFWYSDFIAQEKQPDIHLNLWIGYNNESSFVDVGVRFYRGTRINQFFLYIPFETDLANVEDLFDSFSYEDVVRGIFNKSCEIVRKVPGKYIELLIENEKEKIVPLNRTGPTFSRCEQGMILCLNIENIISMLNNNNIYIRWRMPYSILASIMKKRHFGNFSIDSPYIISNFRYFFKMNEIRSLPLAVKEKFDSNNNYFDKVTLILVNNSQIEVNTQSCYKIRVLEQDLFKNYKPKTYIEKHSNVYQWHVNNSDNCIIIETQLREINWLSILIYFLVIFFTSLFTDGLIECLKSYIL